MERGFAVARKSDDIEGFAGGVHGLQLPVEQTGHLGAGSETGGAGTLRVETRLAVEAVKGADFPVVGREIHSE